MRAWIILAGLLAALLGPARAADEPSTPYLLGPQDKLRLRVVEWQPVEGAARDWSALSGEYVVGPDGHIAVPLLGRVLAAGRAAEAVGAEIGPRLQAALGLVAEPGVALEIVAYRPVYVVGQVREPGLYAFQPGMNVVKALAAAGGLRMAANEDGESSDRALIRAAGELAQAGTERAGLLARQARLRAEAEGASTITFPDDLRETAAFAELERGERALLAARRDRLERQRTALSQLTTLLRRELESFETKIAVQERQRDAAREELAGVERLKRQGLAATNRVRGVSQTLAQIETNILNIESERLRALQDLNRAERDLVAVESERAAEIATLLQQTEAELMLNRQRAAMLRALAADARRTASVAAAAYAASQAEPVVRYAVMRDGARLDATRTSPLAPGDVVEVSVTMPAPLLGSTAPTATITTQEVGQ